MIYRALKQDFHLGRQTQFYRILPEGKRLDSFGMDEVDVPAMIHVNGPSRNHGRVYEQNARYPCLSTRLYISVKAVRDKFETDGNQRPTKSYN